MSVLRKYPVIALTGILALSAAGCRTLRAPSNPYETWTAPESRKPSESIDPIWESIRGQEFDFSEPLSLPELTSIALQNNPATRQAWENARSAEAGLGQARSALYPQAALSADARRQRTTSSGESGNLDNLNYGPALKLTYLILDSGGRNAEIEKTFQTVLAANYEFNQSLQDLILEVEKTYYEYYSSKSALEAAQADLRDAKTSLASAQQKFKVGLVSKLDVLQAKSNYEEGLYALEETKGQLQSAKADLAQVLGIPADTDFEIDEPAGEIPSGMLEEDVTMLIEEAIEKRADISALRASLHAKESGVKAVDSDLWPSLSAGGSAGKNWYEYYGNGTENENDTDYTGYLNIKWDIFDGHYNLNRKREAMADARAEEAKLIQAELKASAEVWTKYYNFRTAIRKLTFSESFLETAKASYDLALEGYNAGLKNMLDLLQAQSKLSEARNKLVQSRKDLFISLADLAHATGSLEIKK